MDNSIIFNPDSTNRIAVFNSGEYTDVSAPILHSKESGFLFMHILSGEVCIESPDYLKTAKMGDLVIIHPFEECVLYRGKSDVSAISFSVSSFMLEAMYDVLGIDRVFSAPCNVLDKFIRSVDLYDKYYAGDYDSGRKLYEATVSIMIDVAALNAVSSEKAKPSAELIRDYLELCICGDVDLDNIGERFGISGMHVIRLFKNKYDTTPMLYLKTLRLKKSAELLCRSSMTIKEISTLLKFSSTQHFTNLFRDHFGVSPGKYREKMMKKNNRKK